MYNYKYNSFDRRRRNLGRTLTSFQPLAQVLVSLFINIALMVLVEFTNAFWLWTDQKQLFGVRLCQYVWISKVLPEIMAVQGTAFLVFGTWTNARKGTEDVEHSESHCKAFLRNIFVTLLVSLSCIVILVLSRIYQPQVGQSASLALQDWNLFESETCPSAHQHLTWYSLVFRWFIGFIVPLIFSFALLVDLSLCRQLKRSVKQYTFLSVSLIICHLITQTPSMIMDFMDFAVGVNVNKNAFATVASIMTKLHYSLFPIAVICFLPWKRQTIQEDRQHQLRFLYRRKSHHQEQDCRSTPENKDLLE